MFVSTFLRFLQFHPKLLRGEGSRSSSSLNHGMFQTGCRLKLAAQSWLGNDNVFFQVIYICIVWCIQHRYFSSKHFGSPMLHLYLSASATLDSNLGSHLVSNSPQRIQRPLMLKRFIFSQGGSLGFDTSSFLGVFLLPQPSFQRWALSMQVDSHRQPLRCVSLVDGHPVGGTQKSIYKTPHQQGQRKL